MEKTLNTNEALLHSWEQSWETVTVVVPNCPKSDKTKLSITAKSDMIDIRYKERILSGKLQFSIYPNETTWYYNNDTLYIELAKVDQHKWWRCIVEGIEEKEIPLEPRKKHEYPDYVQAMLDRKGDELRMAQTRPDLVQQNK
jgi:hypothetical protein